MTAAEGAGQEPVPMDSKAPKVRSAICVQRDALPHVGAVQSEQAEIWLKQAQEAIYDRWRYEDFEAAYGGNGINGSARLRRMDALNCLHTAHSLTALCRIDQ